MPEIDETRLPGIGSRFDFATRAGCRLGVMVRHTGRRDLLIYDKHDPDSVLAEVPLNPEEAQALADLLAVTSVTDRIAELTEVIHGLALDWVPIPDSFTPCTIGETEMRRRTGSSIIAILRPSGPVPAPGPEDRLEPGDTVVLVGTPTGLKAAADLLGI
ncbi:MAG: hypothetical protein N2037_02700 [Acidimicrobiales bacterium]|nr:hypothetical protein [Acidimicrobiales bacterium]